jgi:hypothetical protein
MLALKQGLSLVSSNKVGGAGAWSPTDEASLEAWYQKGEGVSLNGSDVSRWNDQSSNNYHMVQGTESEQPAYADGVLTFVSADTQNLQTSGQISIAGEFTVGFKAHPTTFNNVIIGDNTTSNEFFKYAGTTKFTIKIDGAARHLEPDSGVYGDDYIVITRDGSNVLKMHLNGVLQTDSETLTGTTDIDALGVRSSDTNPYEGTIEEVQIFASQSETLTANINERLAAL